MTISVDDLRAKLVGWGYRVTTEPMEQRPAGMIEMKYDAEWEPEDVAMTSYQITNVVDLTWFEATPITLPVTIKTLMGHLGGEYAILNRFKVSGPRITRPVVGTMYEVVVKVVWIEFFTID